MLTQLVDVGTEGFFIAKMEPERGVLPTILQSFGLHFSWVNTERPFRVFALKNFYRYGYI